MSPSIKINYSSNSISTNDSSLADAYRSYMDEQEEAALAHPQPDPIPSHSEENAISVPSPKESSILKEKDKPIHDINLPDSTIPSDEAPVQDALQSWIGLVDSPNSIMDDDSSDEKDDALEEDSIIINSPDAKDETDSPDEAVPATTKEADSSDEKDDALEEDSIIINSPDAKDETDSPDEAVPATIKEVNSNVASARPQESSNVPQKTDQPANPAIYLTDKVADSSTLAEWEALYPALSGKYQLLQQIGHGAQGKVFKAYSIKTHRLVAIKVFDFTRLEGWKEEELLRREVATLKSLDCNGIPDYIDYIEDLPYIFLVESYIEAQSLESLISAEYHFSDAQFITILRGTALILDQLHDRIQPVIHRDIKPGNILFDPQTRKVWIVDFGTVAAIRQRTMAMTFAGTIGYAAPEQLYGKVTSAADIFGLGATMLHLLCGISPCDMEMKGLAFDYDRYLPANTPKWLSELLRDMTKPDPGERLSSAAEVIRRIDTGIAEYHLQKASAPPVPKYDTSNKAVAKKIVKINGENKPIVAIEAVLWPFIDIFRFFNHKILRKPQTIILFSEKTMDCILNANRLASMRNFVRIANFLIFFITFFVPAFLCHNSLFLNISILVSIAWAEICNIRLMHRLGCFKSKNIEKRLDWYEKARKSSLEIENNYFNACTLNRLNELCDNNIIIKILSSIAEKRYSFNPKYLDNISYEELDGIEDIERLRPCAIITPCASYRLLSLNTFFFVSYVILIHALPQFFLQFTNLFSLTYYVVCAIALFSAFCIFFWHVNSHMKPSINNSRFIDEHEYNRSRFLYLIERANNKH